MEDFIELSRKLGKNILFVQGAGGNSSVKVKNKMYIKASGIRMDSMKIKSGYACCDYKELSRYLSKKRKYSQKDEDEFVDLVSKSIIKSESLGNPSMETGFHAVIKSKYIFHLHSIYSNIFLCMKGGSKVIRELFKDIPNIIIDYKNPGYELSLYISNLEKLPNLIFLKNHGIIIHGNNLKQCLELSKLINKRIEDYLKTQDSFLPFQVFDEVKIGKKYLFPDSAVFSRLDFSAVNSKKKKDIFEIYSAQLYILKLIKKQKGQPVFLTKQEFKKVIGMKQEKERLAKN